MGSSPSRLPQDALVIRAFVCGTVSIQRRGPPLSISSLRSCPISSMSGARPYTPENSTTSAPKRSAAPSCYCQP